MKGIEKITVIEDVALVTLSKVPADLGLIAELLTDMGENGINIDMISQTTPLDGTVSLSFTAPGSDLTKILPLAAKFRDRHPSIRPLVSSANAKISLYGSEMPKMTGVAAGAIRAVSGELENIYLITTSECDISFLVPDADLNAALSALSAYSGLTPAKD